MMTSCPSRKTHRAGTGSSGWAVDLIAAIECLFEGEVAAARWPQGKQEHCANPLKTKVLQHKKLPRPQNKLLY
jgi:hypothetical protein